MDCHHIWHFYLGTRDPNSDPDAVWQAHLLDKSPPQPPIPVYLTERCMSLKPATAARIFWLIFFFFNLLAKKLLSILQGWTGHQKNSVSVRELDSSHLWGNAY